MDDKNPNHQVYFVQVKKHLSYIWTSLLVNKNYVTIC